MKQSVIISTYNQPEWLAKVLHGYLYQTFTNFEILIADDGSGEATRSVIENFRPLADFPVKHVWHEDQGFRKCTILNKATLEAEGEYLVFTDGDCIPRRDFLATHSRLAAPGKFLSGGYCKLPMALSRELTRDDIASGRVFSMPWMRRHGLRGFSKCTKLAAGPRQAALLDRWVPTKASWNGHGSSTWKKHVLEVNGHNEQMKYGGEDREFGERLMNLGLTGNRIRYRAVLLHLDHARGYVNQEDLATNKALRQNVIATGETWSCHGIVKEAAPSTAKSL